MSTLFMSARNCTLYPDLQPNPDISGIGVSLSLSLRWISLLMPLILVKVFYSFLITAYVAFICCVVKLILDHLQDQKQRTSGRPSPKIQRWSLAFRGAVVSFGDQQLLTGISILVAGFSHLRSGIATYHWQSVVNQAWLSTVTHLITLTAMKDELHKSRRKNTLTIVRLACMGILISMLIVALFPMGYINSPTYYADSLPAWCYYHKDLEWRKNLAWESTDREKKEDEWSAIDKLGYNWLYYVLSIAILIYTFLTRVLWLQTNHLGLFRRFKDAVRTGSERRLSQLRDNRKDQLFAYLMYMIGTSLHASLVSSVDLYSSTLWEVSNCCSVQSYVKVLTFSRLPG